MLAADTIIIQNKFAEYCRNGKLVDIPGVIEGRLFHYRRLVFNAIKDNLESAFLITHSVMSEIQWNDLLDNFFSNHKCQTPLVWQIAYEFYEFIVIHEYANKLNLPYLNNLLFFEWIEIEIFMMEDVAYPLVDDNGDLFHDIMVFNPEYKIIALEYPVHKVSPDKSMALKGEYYVLIFRERETGRLQFVDISSLHVLLVENISTLEISMKEVIILIEDSYHLNFTTNQVQELIDFFQQLKDKCFVIGFKN